MSIAERVKGMLGKHSDKAEKVVDQAGDAVDKKTDGKYSDKVDTAQTKAKDFIEDQKPTDPDQPG